MAAPGQAEGLRHTCRMKSAVCSPAPWASRRIARISNRFSGTPRPRRGRRGLPACPPPVLFGHTTSPRPVLTSVRPTSARTALPPICFGHIARSDQAKTRTAQRAETPRAMRPERPSYRQSTPHLKRLLGPI
jgi:hypothetical protein